MKTNTTLIAVWLALISAGALAGQQPAVQNPAAQASVQPPAADLGPVLAEIERAGGPKEYPDANALVIFDKSRTVFDETGESTATEHAVVKVLTDKGKQTYATRKLPYHRRYTTVKVLLARVIKKDGRVVPVPPESIKDGTMEETQAMNILDENFRRLSVVFPGVEVGDSAEMIVETRSQPLVRGHYNDFTVFQALEPVLRKEVTIEGPANKPLRWVVRDGKLEFSRQQQGDRTIYRWRAANLPKIEQELAMGSAADFATRVLASTFTDWRELSRYGDGLNVGKVDTNEAMKAKVAELTREAATKKDKILAIFRYVSQKVRYMGSSMDLGAFIEPHPATYTFEKQYGVCRDKSILMMAMLREIGVEAYDAMINVSRTTDPEIPLLFFEHAICGVVMDDGTIVYMDPTLELSSSFGETYVGGRSVLLLDDQGRDLIHVPPIPAAENLGAIQAETQILADGGLKGKVRISGKGFYDYVLRTIAKQVPAFQFPMVFQQLGQLLASTIKVENVKPGEFADLGKPYEITFDYRAADYVIDIGRLALVKIPFSSQAFDIISVGLFQALADRQERKTPIFLFAPRGCRQEETIRFPAGYRVKAVPDPVSVREGPVSLSLKAETQDNQVLFTSDFRIEVSSLDPRGYQALRQVVKGLRRFQKSMVILEKVEAPAAGGGR